MERALRYHRVRAIARPILIELPSETETVWDLPWNLPIWPMMIGAGMLHLTIGAIAARIAHRKGRDLAIWLPIGLLAGTPALIAAWRLAPTHPPAKTSEADRGA